MGAAILFYLGTKICLMLEQLELFGAKLTQKENATSQGSLCADKILGSSFFHVNCAAVEQQNMDGVEEHVLRGCHT